MVSTPGNLVHQTTTGTSTGNLGLTTVFGKRSFNDEFGTGGTDVFTYLISSRDAAEWEIGTGHLSTSTTLVRDTVLRSSNANAAVNFSAGSKDVTNTYIAEDHLPRGYIDGLELSNAADADHDITIAAGQCRDDDDDGDITRTAAITKQIDAVWAVGTNAGGLDTGTVTLNDWYHVFAIRRPDTGVVDALFSTSFASPTMPTSYTQKRRIGAVLTDASSNILPFLQTGDVFEWDTPVADIDIATLGGTRASQLLTVPTEIKVLARIAIIYRANTGTGFCYISDLDRPSTAASITNFTLTNPSSAARGSTFGEFVTNTSAQIGAINDVANSELDIITHGWVDPRGRDG